MASVQRIWVFPKSQARCWFASWTLPRNLESASNFFQRQRMLSSRAHHLLPPIKDAALAEAAAARSQLDAKCENWQARVDRLQIKRPGGHRCGCCGLLIRCGAVALGCMECGSLTAWGDRAGSRTCTIEVPNMLCQILAESGENYSS